MIKFTAVSVVLYLANMLILKLYVRYSKGAAFRLRYDLYKGKEKIWYAISGLWSILNIIFVAVCAIKLIFMYL